MPRILEHLSNARDCLVYPEAGLFRSFENGVTSSSRGCKPAAAVSAFNVIDPTGDLASCADAAVAFSMLTTRLALATLHQHGAGQPRIEHGHFCDQ